MFFEDYEKAKHLKAHRVDVKLEIEKICWQQKIWQCFFSVGRNAFNLFSFHKCDDT